MRTVTRARSERANDMDDTRDAFRLAAFRHQLENGTDFVIDSQGVPDDVRGLGGSGKGGPAAPPRKKRLRTRPGRVCFFKFYRAGRVRDASAAVSPRLRPALPGGRGGGADALPDVQPKPPSLAVRPTPPACVVPHAHTQYRPRATEGERCGVGSATHAKPPGEGLLFDDSGRTTTRPCPRRCAAVPSTSRRAQGGGG
eukprot:gene16159-biopygen14310